MFAAYMHKVYFSLVCWYVNVTSLLSERRDVTLLKLNEEEKAFINAHTLII